ncbi:MAG TPA: EAL domain-containing protein [Thiobacillaceae bacterium]|nr:EAL domain-containing protein [Thiobacillaceae bacterium]
MRLSLRSLSLRTKMLLASLLVEAIMLAVLMGNSVRVAQDELSAQARLRIESMAPLLNAALAGPLVQHDYATLQDILTEAIRSEGFAYLVLLDPEGGRIAQAGLGPEDPLPPLDRTLAGVNDRIYDASTSIGYGRARYGQLQYGISTGFIEQARSRLYRQGVLIAGGGILLTFVLLLLLAYWLTRRLDQLTHASLSLAEQRFDTPLPAPGKDEVGRLSAAFQAMSGQLRTRMAQLQDSEQRFHAIAQYTYDLELWADTHGKVIWINPSVQRMTGYTPEECLSMADFPLTLVMPEDLPEARHRFQLAVQGVAGEGYQFRMRRRDGSELWAAANWLPIYDRQGTHLGLRASVRDITQLKQVEQSLRDSLTRLQSSEALARQYLGDVERERARLMALLAAMNLGILFVGVDRRVVYHNPAFQHIWLIPDALSLVGLPANQVFEHGVCRIVRADDYRKHLERVMESREITEIWEINLRDGRVITQISYPVQERDGQIIGHLWVYEDVTQERQTAEQLLRLAERDALTGLYNRHRFQAELERMLTEAIRHDTSCALLFFDLDEFKAINDHFGHRAGDTLLVRVANELGGVVRKHESLFRLGGDEFAVLMPYADTHQAEALAERIVRAVAQIPFHFDGQNLRISSSLGISLFPDHTTDLEQLVAYADAAMYQAKQAGKNAWRIYRADLDQTPEMVNRLSWNERIDHALAQDLFELHFQGVYGARDRRLVHLEALLRLRDGETGELIPPGRFIPVAEKGPKIVDIDRWVLRRAIHTLAERPNMPDIAVNISGRSFDDPSLPEYIAEQLRLNKVAASRLLVEVTETAAVSDLADAERFIEALKKAGCRVCLDDFGAGFASFAYLKHIRVDVIKIDGMFTRNLTHDHDNQVFVRGMVEVARGLGKTTIAECVEDEITLDLLAHIGVDQVQGFHLDRPQQAHPALDQGQGPRGKGQG